MLHLERENIIIRIMRAVDQFILISYKLENKKTDNSLLEVSSNFEFALNFDVKYLHLHLKNLSF